MSKITIVQVSPEDLKEQIIQEIKSQLSDFKNHLDSKKPNDYLTKAEVSKMLQVDLSTLHNWKKKGLLIPVGLGRRVWYKREDVENAIIKLKK